MFNLSLPLFLSLFSFAGHSLFHPKDPKKSKNKRRGGKKKKSRKQWEFWMNEYVRFTIPRRRTETMNIRHSEGWGRKRSGSLADFPQIAAAAVDIWHDRDITGGAVVVTRTFPMRVKARATGTLQHLYWGLSWLIPSALTGPLGWDCPPWPGLTPGGSEDKGEAEGHGRMDGVLFKRSSGQWLLTSVWL